MHWPAHRYAKLSTTPKQSRLSLSPPPFLIDSLEPLPSQLNLTENSSYSMEGFSIGVRLIAPGTGRGEALGNPRGKQKKHCCALFLPCLFAGRPRDLGAGVRIPPLVESSRGRHSFVNCPSHRKGGWTCSVQSAPDLTSTPYRNLLSPPAEASHSIPSPSLSFPCWAHSSQPLSTSEVLPLFFLNSAAPPPAQLLSLLASALLPTLSALSSCLPKMLPLPPP